MSYQGRFKSFNPIKGWGFLTDTEGKDVFFHSSKVIGRQPQEGDLVAFDLEESPVKAGQMCAVNITGGSSGGSNEGTIKSYNIEKGWGFIEHNGTTVFLHRSEVRGNLPQPGDQVFFDIGTSPKDPNQIVALNVNGGSGPPLEKILRANSGKGAPILGMDTRVGKTPGSLNLVMGTNWGKGGGCDGWGKGGGGGWGKGGGCGSGLGINSMWDVAYMKGMMEASGFGPAGGKGGGNSSSPYEGGKGMDYWHQMGLQMGAAFTG